MKKNTVLENLEITDIAAEGVSVARFDNYVIFVKDVVPGDIVDVVITRPRKSYAESKLLKIKKLSEERIEPFCEHFTKCGGCKWQMLSYDKQLFYKQKQVVDQLTRIGGIKVENINPIIPSEKTKFYRNKLEYSFSYRRWLDLDEPVWDKGDRELEGLGFHVTGMFDRIININNCYLQEIPSNDIRNKIRKFTTREGYDYYNSRSHEGFMRNLIIRNSTLGELMIVLIFNYYDKTKIENLLNFIYDDFPQITSLQYVVNPKFNDSIYDQDVILYKGKDFINEKLGDLLFKINAKSFFQTNTLQTEKLYDKVVEYAEIKPDDIIYDLYTGTGTIANYVAKKCKMVVGIESVPEAIEDAKINSKINNIENTAFFAADIKDLLNVDFMDKYSYPNTIILDPPRAGIHENVVAAIRHAKPQIIVYVSCNPATQARDINLLSDIYDIVEIQPFDMFPHTQHVENIVKLVKK